MTLAAVDLGASSGRVITGSLRNGRFELAEVARFTNAPVALPTGGGTRHKWDVLRLWTKVADGLNQAARSAGTLESIGIDTWAVDYGLLDASGELIGNPASYRCDRTVGAPGRFHDVMGADRLYSLNGLQTLAFNTVFQLSVEDPERLAAASRLLLLPDLLGYWLTGRAVAEVTNASTTGLLDPSTRQWSREVLGALRDGFGHGVDPLLAEVVEPGAIVGPVERGISSTSGRGEPTPLVAVGTHDTASAIVAVPAETPGFAYISCGTWSLVGLELDAPVLTEAARAANLTNELGVDGTVRFLKNVMGLWVFNECVSTWRAEGRSVSVPDLVAAAAKAEALRTVIDIDDESLFAPGDMPRRVLELAARAGEPAPCDEGELARCIFDSLALAYRRSVRQAADVAGKDVSVIHMVGGGVQNTLLCQLTANASGLRVVAGPVEGTALGNLAVQARAIGLIDGGLAELRRVIAASSELVTYDPEPAEAAAWTAAEARVGASTER